MDKSRNQALGLRHALSAAGPPEKSDPGQQLKRVFQQKGQDPLSRILEAMQISLRSQIKKAGQRERQRVGGFLGKCDGDLAAGKATWSLWVEPESGKSFMPDSSLELFIFFS